MGGAYPYMDLNAKYGKLLRQSIQIRISPKRGKCTWNSNLQAKCRTERRFHAFKFSDGYKSTMDWCSVYLTPQALPKYIYRSPPLIFPTTSTELGQKTARCESLGALLHYVEWDRFVTLSAQADWGLRYRIKGLTPYIWVSFQGHNLDYHRHMLESVFIQWFKTRDNYYFCWYWW